MMNQNEYDVIIIGGGPAGYTAGLYCGRATLKTLLFEKYMTGGQMGTTAHVDNYPGFPEGVDGFTLGMDMKKQAERFDVVTKSEEVTAVSFGSKIKEVTTSQGVYTAKTVIIATGASPRELGLPAENELRGKGVSYCATCDGAFFRGKSVAVIGGGDTAAVDAIFLSKFCKEVFLVHRKDALRAAVIYHEILANTPNVTFVWDSSITEILHENVVTGIRVQNLKTEQEQEIECQGVFVAIGNVPNTKLFEGILDRDPTGYLVAGEDTTTKFDGVYVVGDVRTKHLRQIVTAVSDGAVAAFRAEEYISCSDTFAK